ncbi:MAG TPA: sel1 repeat family protein [Oscillibacter sp.]|nr:MAG: sel1 repeat family protein [Oscillibacter sp.]HBL64488.1 sel1 repeat family protein [Oscillibacter sp.]HCV07425.1 sel1 repeat family protein [Oscillibacter sp.]
MWKCPVCDQENNAATVCPTCGFDGSCDYEHYPTPFAVAGAKSTRALRREWEQKQGPGLDQLLMEWFIGSHQKKDATAAERCFREKAEAGDAAAQWWLGASYQYGVGAEKNHRQALHWYRLAARQGSQPAQDMLQALSGQARERQLEQQLLEHAEQGDAQAQYEVGRRFWNGDGVDQDHKQAADWFDRAARQGLAAAQCALGLCYERGDGVEQDMWQAAAWYQWAAQQDDVEAQLHLSECYEKGRGVPKDKEKAAEWLYKAAQHGGSYVKKWLKTLKK